MRVALDPTSGLQWMKLAQATLNAGDVEGAEALVTQSMQMGNFPAIFQLADMDTAKGEGAIAPNALAQT